jgi:23S rRNA (cytosine1962-C5)-methyltransferase
MSSNFSLARSAPKIRLLRNLRKSILQGHPWVYREALDPAGASQISSAQLVRVDDSKGFLAWAFFDPHSPIALRILSTHDDLPDPRGLFLEKQIARALQIRSAWLDSHTTAFRLINGEGDDLPGLICDIYGPTAVLQFDGKGPAEFWNSQAIAAKLQSVLSPHLPGGEPLKRIVSKVRRPGKNQERIELIHGEPLSQNNEPQSILEHQAIFHVDIVRGQKTGFFLDQRENRLYIRQIARGKSVLNLFSYTGGFSINAGIGGASHITSVDLSHDILKECEAGLRRNGIIGSSHTEIASDAFEFIKLSKDFWDLVIVDPPSMSHSEERKAVAVEKYIDLFQHAIRRVHRCGEVALSSCSSHISFADFHEIVTESLSKARRKGKVLRISGQGPDHPFPNACPELRYLKFFHLALD